MEARSAEILVESPRRKLFSFLPLDRIRISMTGLIASCLIVIPLVFAVVVWRHYTQSADSVLAQPAAVATPEAPSFVPADGARPNVPAIPDPTPEILRLPGVEPFLNPKVAKKLDLTPSQMGVFGRLNKTTQQALADLEKYWESDGRLELAQRQNVLLEAARREALQVLTDQQRQTWEAMAR